MNFQKNLIPFLYIRTEANNLGRLTKRTILDPSAENIHNLRISTRRVQAALWVLRQGVSGHHLLGSKRTLRTLENKLGEIRELDVAISDAQEYSLNENSLKRKRKEDHNKIRKFLNYFQAGKRFYPENLLQSDHEFAKSDQFRSSVELRSDATVDILINNQHRFLVPLEYESHLKSIDRCKEKLMGYYLKDPGKAVLFICKDDVTLKRFESIEQGLSHNYKPKMYFALLSEILAKPEELTFKKVGGAEYKIR
jgi:hypothetical protein